MAVAPNGTLAVLDRSAYEVLLYDPSGRFLRAIGRRGQGPGEFEFPDRLGFRGDTLWVSDTRLNRVALFALDGRLTEAISLSSLASTSGWAQALSPQGAVIVVPPITVGGPGAGIRRPYSVIALSRRSRRVDTLHVVQRSEGVRFIPLPRGRIAILDPYAEEPIVEASPYGDHIAIIDRPIASALNDTTTYGITVLASNGTPISSRRHRYVPRPVTEAERDSVYRSILHPDHVPGLFPSEEAALRAIGEGIPTPKFWPPILDVRAGTDSTIWLRQSRDEWLVLDRSANVVATVRVPAGIRVMAIQRGHVWGVRLDEDDLPVLTRYRVTPVAEAPAAR